MTSVSSTCNHIIHHCSRALTALCISIFYFGSLSGCGERLSEHGNTVNQTTLSTLKIGHSKRSDIVNALGFPSFEGAFDKQKLYYVSQTMAEPVAGINTTTARNIYIFSFDTKDTLQKIDLIDKNSGVNVEYISEKTPTSGDNFGVFEQIFANIKRQKASK